MSDDHAKRVAEIEAVTKDYVEASEPPVAQELPIDLETLIALGGGEFTMIDGQIYYIDGANGITRFDTGVT